MSSNSPPLLSNAEFESFLLNEDDYIFDGFDDNAFCPIVEDALSEQDSSMHHPLTNDESCPRPEQWADVKFSKENTKFTIDQAKNNQWKLAKQEIKHVRSRFSILADIEEEKVRLDDIFEYFAGENSTLAKLFWKELSIDDELYLKFMHTAVLQSAY